MSKFSRTRTSSLNAQCQKCYRHGHWTYECKNPKVYLVRPSHTAILKNSKLKPRLNDDEDIPEIPRITDGDYNRDPYYSRKQNDRKKATKEVSSVRPASKSRSRSTSLSPSPSNSSSAASNSSSSSSSSESSGSDSSRSSSSTSRSSSSSSSSAQSSSSGSLSSSASASP